MKVEGPVRVMRCAVLLGCFGLVGCGGSASGEGALSGFTVSLEDGAIDVRHASGLHLATASAAAFSFRKAAATYEMQFGSFLIEERARSEWVIGVAFDDVDVSDDRITAKILDADGEVLADLSITPLQDNLQIVATAVDHNRARVHLGCDDGGGFLGFGAQTHDVDHRGQTVPVFVSEQGIGKVDTDEPDVVWFLIGTRHQSYLSVPTVVAPRGGASYGLHLDTFRRSIWDLCDSDPNVLTVEAWEGRVGLMLSPGPSPLDVVRQQTRVTGRIPKPPAWTFGVWMEAIGGRDAVLEEARLLREHAIPASALWTEDWRGGIDQGSQYVLEEDWRLDEALYPDVDTLITSLHDDGFQWTTYFNTFITEAADVWDEAHADGHFVVDRAGEPYLFQAPDFETSGLADLFRAPTRRWVQDELEAALAIGIDGWMADFAEWYPADPTTVLPTGDRSAEDAHHEYPVLWAEVNRDAVEASGRDDIVIFHRSGYTGSQGLAHVVWAGDQRTTFGADDGLATIVPILLGLSVTGFPVVTHDIAGYVSATNPPSTKELFWRWTSLGALAPIMRTHHGRAVRDNWRWSRDADTIAHFKTWADLHTRLYPFWMGLALDASETGAPIVRPMAFQVPGDARYHGLRDVFMLGDAWLVAPVVTSSVTSREVLVPPGTWFDRRDGARYSEGTASFEVPLGDAVILARAGAVVPMLPEGVQTLVASDAVTTLADVAGERVVEVWLGASGTGRDAGDGRFSVTSDSIPDGALATVSGGSFVSNEDGRALVRADGAEVSIVDGGGATHVLRAEAAPASIIWDVRW